MFLNKLHTVCNSWIASVSTQETINVELSRKPGEIMRGNLAMELGKSHLGHSCCIPSTLRVLQSE